MSDTPRTDAFMLQRQYSEKQFPDVQELIDHARQLERELAAAEAALAIANESVRTSHAETLRISKLYDAMEDRVAAAEAKVKALDAKASVVKAALVELKENDMEESPKLRRFIPAVIIAALFLVAISVVMCAERPRPEQLPEPEKKVGAWGASPNVA